jgi:hypothetical protein
MPVPKFFKCPECVHCEHTRTTDLCSRFCVAGQKLNGEGLYQWQNRFQKPLG